MRKLITALLVAAILLGAFAVSVNAQTFYQKFENIWAKSLTTSGDVLVGDDLTVTGDIIGALTASSLNTTGNANVDGHLVVDNYLAVSGVPYFVTGAAYAVTDGGTITPAEGVVELTAAGVAGAGLATAADGQLVVLVNTGANTITITDTGTTRLAGDWEGTQYDSLTLIGVGVAWYEVSRSTN